MIVLLVFSPCKVRNSIQDVFEITKTEVSNKSVSTLKNTTCDLSTDINSVISKSSINLEISQALNLNESHFVNNNKVLSDRISIQQYNARDKIPPLAPYYILFKNNKAYL